MTSCPYDYMVQGGCNKGVNCQYLHTVSGYSQDLKSSVITTPPHRMVSCPYNCATNCPYNYNLQGGCNKGVNCRYLHSVEAYESKLSIQALKPELKRHTTPKANPNSPFKLNPKAAPFTFSLPHNTLIEPIPAIILTMRETEPHWSDSCFSKPIEDSFK